MSETLRLKRLADGVVEASCLVAVLAVPLYFSVLTETGYEPDKAVLLRVLACVAGSALILGILVDRKVTPRAIPSVLLLLGLAVFLAYSLSALLSLEPRLSILGSHTRQEGLWTRACYLIFLLAVVTRFRSRDQIERLISVMLLGSAPAVMYGLVQQVGYDPIPSSGDPATLYWPVRSSFGQHVFFASYLVLVMPFTVARVLQNREALRENAAGWWRNREVVLGGLSILLMVATFFTFMMAGADHHSVFVLFPGLLAAYTGISVLLATMRGSVALTQARFAGYGLLLTLQVAALVVTGARGGWLGFLAAIPVFGVLAAFRLKRPRLARSILAVSAAGAFFLVLLNFAGPLQPLRSVHPLNRIANITESGGTGGSAQGRLLIWQGVSRLVTQDPSIGDNWGGPGRVVVGYGPESLAVAFHAVYPLKLRQVTSQVWNWDRAHNVYLDYLVDSGLLGFLLLLAVLVAFAWRVARLVPQVGDHSAWILIGAASGMTAHLVDDFFGLETPVTFLLFWVLVGIVAAKGTGGEEKPELSLASSPAPGSLPSLSTAPVEMQSLLGERVGRLAPYGAVLAVLIVVFSFIPVTDFPALAASLWLLSLLLGLSLVVSILNPQTLSQHQLSVPSGHNADQRLRLLLPLGARSSLGEPGHNAANDPHPIGAKKLVGMTLVFLATVLCLGSQMRFVTAAIAERTGLTYLGSGESQQAIGYLQEANRANGHEPQYETELGGAYLSLGAGHPDSADPAYTPTPQDVTVLSPSRAISLGHDQLFQLGQYALQSARSMSPLDPDTYNNLGSLYLQWNKPDAAMAEFRRAAALSSNNPRYVDQEALAQLQSNNLRQAAGTAQTALNLDNTFWYSYYALSLVHHQMGAHDRARQDAQQSLIWLRNYWPPPPPQQIAQLHTLQQTG